MDPTPFDLERHVQQHGAALRRLAWQLTRDRSQVDDVLQETWMRAFRMPPRHEHQVGGWLATILRRVVGRHRRGEQRRDRRERGAPVEPREADPAERIARTEIVQRLVAAIEALERHHRDAIWQRYFEGLPPREIARRSGVPLLTVKSWLQRGLQRLREQLGGGGESDWRGALVVAFGFGDEAAAALAAWQGGVLMATGTKVAAAVLVTGIALWWWWRTEPRPHAAQVAVVESVPVASVENTPDAAIERTALEPPVAEPAPAAVAPPASNVSTGRIRGRVVAAESGQPLAGIELYRRRGIGDVRWEPDATLQLTGPDGAFEFEVAAGRTPGLMLRGAERPACYWSGLVVAPGQTDDLGDLRLPLGRRVVGRLVDAAGSPVASKLSIEVYELGDAAKDPPSDLRALLGGGPSKRQFGILQTITAQVTSDADGEFALPRSLAVGRCRWTISFGDHELVEPQETVLETGEGPAHVDLVVRRRPEIRGVVVDEVGRPVADVLVGVGGDSGGSVTGADGGFAVFRRRPGDDATLVVSAPEDFAPQSPTGGVRWGTTNVRITLRRPAPFELVVTAPDGAPVESFGVAIERDGMHRRGAVLQRGEHAGGRLAVRGVVPGATRLRVLPTARNWTPSELLPAPDTAPMRVVLQPRLPCKVRVLAGGAPVVGASVRLEHTQQRGGPMVDPHGERAWVPGSGYGRELVDSGTTDAHGQVDLLRDQPTAGRVLHIEVPGRPAHVQPAAFASDGAPMVVELPELGRITGHVVLRDVPRDQIKIVLDGTGRGASCAPQPDGTFELRDLAAGPYTISLARKPNDRLGVLRGSDRVIEVTGGAATEVMFDLADFPLGSVRGRVVTTGALPDGLTVDFVRRAGSGLPELFGSAPVAADGTFSAGDLLPGEYLLGLRTRPRREAWLPGLQPEPLVLLGGEVVGHRIDYRPRRLVVRFCRQDGSDAAGERIRARCGGEQWPGIVLFQAQVEGPLVLEPAPALPIEFRCQAEDSPWSEPVVLPPDCAEAEVTVVLPDPPARR